MENVSCAVGAQGIMGVASVVIFISLTTIQASQEPLPLEKHEMQFPLPRDTQPAGDTETGPQGSCDRILRDVPGTLPVSSHWSQLLRVAWLPPLGRGCKSLVPRGEGASSRLNSHSS